MFIPEERREGRSINEEKTLKAKEQRNRGAKISIHTGCKEWYVHLKKRPKREEISAGKKETFINEYGKQNEKGTEM